MSQRLGRDERNLSERFDVLAVGAGYAGGVAARALAERGKKVLVLERRDHIGGNAYDCLDDHGVLIHKYGPHIFHTNDKKVFDFLSRFTQWRDYQHRVVANIPDPAGEGGPAGGCNTPSPSTSLPWRKLSALRREKPWGTSSFPSTGRRKR